MNDNMLLEHFINTLSEENLKYLYDKLSNKFSKKMILPELWTDEFFYLIKECYNYQSYIFDCENSDPEEFPPEYKEKQSYIENIENQFIEKYGIHSKEHEMFNILISLNYTKITQDAEKLGHKYGLNSHLITIDELIKDTIQIFKNMIVNGDKFRQIGRLVGFYQYYGEYEYCKDNPHYFHIGYYTESWDNSL